jgi:hypothetical protein
MLAVKGRYNGETVVFASIPFSKECDVIVNFPDIPESAEPPAPQPGPQDDRSTIRGTLLDDDSLDYLIIDYVDDGAGESQ